MGKPFFLQSWFPKPVALIAIAFLAFQLNLEAVQYQVTIESKQRVQEFEFLFHPEDIDDYTNVLALISGESPDDEDEPAQVSACATKVGTCGDVNATCGGNSSCCPPTFECRDVRFEELGNSTVPLCVSTLYRCGVGPVTTDPADADNDIRACSGLFWEYDNPTYTDYLTRCEDDELCNIANQGTDDLEALVPIIQANLVFTCWELLVKVVILLVELKGSMREAFSWFGGKTVLEMISKLGTLAARIALVVIITSSSSPDWIREVLERRCASPHGDKVYAEMGVFLEKILLLGTVDLVINAIQLFGEVCEKIIEGWTIYHKKEE